MKPLACAGSIATSMTALAAPALACITRDAGVVARAVAALAGVPVAALTAIGTMLAPVGAAIAQAGAAFAPGGAVHSFAAAVFASAGTVFAFTGTAFALVTSTTARAAETVVARAAENAAPAAQTLPAASLPTSNVGSALFGFLVVLAVMAGAFWLLRRVQGGGLSGSGPLRLVGSIAVGQKERVVLVECSGTWILVGTAPGRVNQLHAMPAPEGAATAAGTTQSGAVAAQELGPQAFRRWLEKAMNKNPGKAE